jgi:superfamily II DNA or RNA helicase
MSLKIPLNSLSTEEKNMIGKKLSFAKKQTKYNQFQPREYVRPYSFDNDENVYIPFFFGQKMLEQNYRRERSEFRKMTTKFSGKLRPLQKTVKKEALQLLNNQGCCLISLYTGAGKTITSIFLATKIGLPCLIVVHRLVLIKQWKESIEKVCKNPKIQILTAKSELKDNMDFYIINAINATKKNFDTFKCIGTLIADEVHVMATDKLSQAFYYVQPRYCLGLSATPYRSDGMDELLFSYFGKKQVHRKLNREHYVFKVKTGFVPEYTIGASGKMDWNSVLQSQTMDVDRNEIIVNIVKMFKERNFLILSKRVEQVKYLVKRLSEEGEDVTSLVGVKKHFDYSSRILVATVQKAGVGFDHPKLDSLIIASDVQEYFIQYLGRVFRVEDNVPVIFDLLDDFSVLKSHYYTRRKVYISHGGKVFDFNSKNVKKCLGITNYNDLFN